MKIARVKKCTIPSYWYSDLIGEEFIVKEKKDPKYFFEVVGKRGYSIEPDDCEILGDIQDLPEPVHYDDIQEIYVHKNAFNKSRFDKERSILVTIQTFLYYGGDLYKGRELYTEEATDENPWPLGKYHHWDLKLNCPIVKTVTGKCPCSILDKVRVIVKPVWS